MSLRFQGYYEMDEFISYSCDFFFHGRGGAGSIVKLYVYTLEECFNRMLLNVNLPPRPVVWMIS